MYQFIFTPYELICLTRKAQQKMLLYTKQLKWSRFLRLSFSYIHINNGKRIHTARYLTHSYYGDALLIFKVITDEDSFYSMLIAPLDRLSLN